MIFGGTRSHHLQLTIYDSSVIKYLDVLYEHTSQHIIRIFALDVQHIILATATHRLKNGITSGDMGNTLVSVEKLAVAEDFFSGERDVIGVGGEGKGYGGHQRGAGEIET